MTSRVMVTAYCGKDKEVVFQLWGKNTEVEYLLQDQESKELSIYDDIKVCAFERKKLPQEDSPQGELF